VFTKYNHLESVQVGVEKYLNIELYFFLFNVFDGMID